MFTDSLNNYLVSCRQIALALTQQVTTPQIKSWIDAEPETLPATQSAILDAAAYMFTTNGFAAASVDLIANKIGVTKGSVYYYYRSKADLFFAVHKRAMVMNLREMTAIVKDAALKPKEKLHAMAYRHAMLMMNHLDYQRVTVQGVALHQSGSTTPAERDALSEVMAMRDAYENLFVDVLKAGVAKKVFENMDCALAARSILGSLNWITVWFRPRDADTDVFKKKVALQMARQAVHGVALQA